MTDAELMQALQEIDKELEMLSERTQRASEHRRELIHRNSLNKNPAFTEYLSKIEL